MKRHSTIATLLLLLMTTGTMKAQQFQPYKSGVITYHGYAYPVVPGTEEWKALGYQQRVASLQLPLDTLSQMSTTRLLETCLYYPFNIDIFAFDDQISSFGRVKNLFNGYAELYQRTDFVQQLINLYDARDFADVDRIALNYDKGLYSFDYCIMEFMFTDAACMASDTQAEQIVVMLLEKLEQKYQNQVFGYTNRIIIGLAIGRCLQRTNAFRDYLGATLNDFLQTGKLSDPADLVYVFNKAKSINSPKQ